MAQAEQNAAAQHLGPLPAVEVAAIGRLLDTTALQANNPRRVGRGTGEAFANTLINLCSYRFPESRASRLPTEEPAVTACRD